MKRKKMIIVKFRTGIKIGIFLEILNRISGHEGLSKRKKMWKNQKKKHDDHKTSGLNIINTSGDNYIYCVRKIMINDKKTDYLLRILQSSI